MPLPGGGIAVRRLRTRFLLARNQIAISEIGFETTPADAEALEQSAETRRNLQPPPLTEPEMLPRAVDRTIRRPSPRSMFGVCGHLMHTDFFYHNGAAGQVRYSPYWRREYTLPWIVEGCFRSVREPVYAWWIEPGKDGGRALNGNTREENRRMIESDIAAYAEADVDVVLAPFLISPDTPEGKEHYRWLASLAGKFGNITGFEMHNEPNLKGFWDAPVEQYVEWVRKVAAILHEEAPGVPVIVGSFSGWGTHRDWEAKPMSTREPPAWTPGTLRNGPCSSGCSIRQTASRPTPTGLPALRKAAMNWSPPTTPTDSPERSPPGGRWCRSTTTASGR